MTFGLVDLHCHLDLYPDFPALVEECERAGVYTLAVTTTPRAWERNRDLASRTKHVRPALGLHPQVVSERWREINEFERKIGEARYIGEVGLDAGPRFFRSFELQKNIFRRILEACASEGGKILSVHSVRAGSAVLDLIEECLPAHRGKVVLHWFTGSAAEARRAVGLGCYFSINTQMLTNARGTALVTSLPQNRLLTETDGPFVRATSDRPARPIDVHRAVDQLSIIRCISTGICRNIITENLQNLTRDTLGAAINM